MRKFLLALTLIIIALPAFAEPPAKTERKQETIELGNNRFLIFMGEPNGSQFAYTVDLVVTSNGVPHFEPLFTQEYDVDTNTVNLTEGVVFQSKNYHFDKAANTLDYTTFDADKQARFQYKYHFATDMFMLTDVVMQKGSGSLLKILYTAKK